MKEPTQVFGSPRAVGVTSSGWIGKIWLLDNVSTDIQFKKNGGTHSI